jgi:hypothetical protein
MNAEERKDCLEAVAGILLRCFLLTFCLMLIWFVIFLVGVDWAYKIHSSWFNITRTKFDLMMYYGLAFFKMTAFLFFLIPYISIKLFLRNK